MIAASVTDLATAAKGRSSQMSGPSRIAAGKRNAWRSPGLPGVLVFRVAHALVFRSCLSSGLLRVLGGDGFVVHRFYRCGCVGLQRVILLTSRFVTGNAVHRSVGQPLSSD